MKGEEEIKKGREETEWGKRGRTGEAELGGKRGWQAPILLFASTSGSSAQGLFPGNPHMMVSFPPFLPWHDFLRHKKQPGPYPWLGRGSFSPLPVLACCEVPSGKIPVSRWESLFRTDSTFKESHCTEVLSLFLRTVFHEPKRRVKFKNNLLFLGVLISFQIYFWKRFLFS